jgi:transaldolase
MGPTGRSARKVGTFMSDSPVGNPVRALLGAGQSPWLDQLRREWLDDGTLARWIQEDGLRGVTSNPAIFREAMAGSAAYDAQQAELVRRGLSTAEIYDHLTLTDITAACDLFRPVYDATHGADGFVSHEVAPDLAYDTWGTVHEARRLWRAVDRPNVMIKIPATAAGLPAIRQCLEDGINVNVTLMFSLAHYDVVADQYIAALTARTQAGLAVDRVASVASFFVSRVDTLVDKHLAARVAEGLPEGQVAHLRGRAAVANSQRAYRRFTQRFTAPEFTALAARGAHVQRVLWASTSSKDPAYSDVIYVEPLIGPDTVNTMPLVTLDAFRDHGRVARTVDADYAEADAVVGELERLGIDLLQVGEALSLDGVKKFQDAQQAVLAAVEARRAMLVGAPATP